MVERGSSRREEYAEATRSALIEAGRDAFVRHGFRDAGIEAISRAARVTRGAFYHHFADKTGLFDALVVTLQADAADRVRRASPSGAPVWERLFVGIGAYLDVCLEPIYARIVVQEAPVVLGERRFREIEEAYPMALLAASLGALQREGEIAARDLDLLTRLVDAMICRLSLLLPAAADPAAMRREGLGMIETLLRAMRAAP